MNAGLDDIFIEVESDYYTYSRRICISFKEQGEKSEVLAVYHGTGAIMNPSFHAH